MRMTANIFEANQIKLVSHQGASAEKILIRQNGHHTRSFRRLRGGARHCLGGILTLERMTQRLEDFFLTFKERIRNMDSVSIVHRIESLFGIDIDGDLVVGQEVEWIEAPLNTIADFVAARFENYISWSSPDQALILWAQRRSWASEPCCPDSFAGIIGLGFGSNFQRSTPTFTVPA